MTSKTEFLDAFLERLQELPPKFEVQYLDVHVAWSLGLKLMMDCEDREMPIRTTKAGFMLHGEPGRPGLHVKFNYDLRPFTFYFRLKRARKRKGI
jgi:hypothetical protein